jgi:hypothetical protein
LIGDCVVVAGGGCTIITVVTTVGGGVVVVVCVVVGAVVVGIVVAGLVVGKSEIIPFLGVEVTMMDPPWGSTPHAVSPPTIATSAMPASTLRKIVTIFLSL